MNKPGEIRVCVLSGCGINADLELVAAFEAAGARCERVHVNDFVEFPELKSFHILAFPGGFSFGDHLGSGQVLAFLLRQRLGPRLGDFLAAGRLMIGICNGFQTMVKMGLLPNLAGDMSREVSLVHNAGGVFVDRWVRCRVEGGNASPWLRGLDELDMPVRHGEGRFVTASPEALARIESSGLVALRYTGGNPNGSEADIAGITDPSGRVLGLMPHPEAFLYPENHPLWTVRRPARGEGLAFFQNGVDYCRTALSAAGV